MRKLNPNSVLVLAIAWCCLALPSAVAQAQPATDKTAGASTREAFSSKANVLVSSAQRLSEQPDTEHAAAAQTCLALAAAHRVKPSESTKTALTQLADVLVAQKDLNRDGRIGWGVPATREKKKSCPEPGMLDAFSDGTCNPVNTEYTFQTGLVVMCLAQAFEQTGESRFRQTAIQALNDSWNVGQKPAGCADCFYYWYSYSANDFNRYVRNTNVLMGAAAAWAWKVSGEPKFRERANQIANSELRELKSGNDGYFGINDRRHLENPSRENKRIENHVPWVAKGLLDIGTILKDDAIVRAAMRVQDSWQFCTDAFTCKSDCDTWAADSSRCTNTQAVSPCFFKSTSARYAQLCEAAASRIQKSPNSYQFWAVVGN